ncbi:MAG: phosphotransferase family protein [Phycisphaerales bacterium]
MQHGGVPDDANGLAHALVPVLRQAVDDRLGDASFFRSAWQRGGSQTAFSTWRLDTGEVVPVIVKLPVSPNEFNWTTLLGKCDQSRWHDADQVRGSTPRVLASGMELGGYDLAWIIVERLAGEPLGKTLDEGSVVDLLAAAADFQMVACRVAPIGPEIRRPRSPDWEQLLGRAREACKTHSLPEWNHWQETIKKVQRALPVLQGRWESRLINSWCHGDLHPGNALHRAPEPGQPEDVNRRHGVVLIDLALVHPGHWVEDALYLERQFWGHTDQLHGVKPVGTLARLRRERSLDVDDSYADLAVVRRVLMAACAPAVLEQEGANPRYLHAALETLNRTLPQVVH